MNFKLPRPIFPEEMSRILSREICRQRIVVMRLSTKRLKELESVCKEIEKEGLPKYLVCKKLPKKLGSGIFLHPDAKPILKGQVIASYAGEVSLVPQTDQEDGSYAFEPLDKIHLTNEEQFLFHKKCTYSSRRNYSLMIDALKKGNFTRFINHSGQPNIVAHLCKVPTNSYGLDPASIEVIYFAKKTILPKEQLLVSYEEGGKTYWGASKIKPFSMTAKTFQLTASLKVADFS